MQNTNKKKEKFEPIPIDTILNSLYFQLRIASLTDMVPSDDLKKMTSTIYYLEELKELKNGSKRNGKIPKRAKGQGDGDSSGSKGKG